MLLHFLPFVTTVTAPHIFSRRASEIHKQDDGPFMLRKNKNMHMMKKIKASL